MVRLRGLGGVFRRLAGLVGEKLTAELSVATFAGGVLGS